jgi:hypothetical protein
MPSHLENNFHTPIYLFLFSLKYDSRSNEKNAAIDWFNYENVNIM